MIIYFIVKFLIYVIRDNRNKIKQKGVGLRFKFTVLNMVLVIITVLIISAPLSMLMITTQDYSLARGLFQRVEVMLGNIATGAGNELSVEEQFTSLNRVEFLLQLTATIEEVKWATIVGKATQDLGDIENFDYIWASNDPDVVDGIFKGKDPGTIRIEDEISPIAKSFENQIDKQAQDAIATLTSELEQMSVESKKLARQLAVREDPVLEKKLKEIQETIRAFNFFIKDELRGIGADTGSVPEFDPQKLLPFYTFYRPIVYRSPGDDIYYRGIVRMGVSTENIIAEIVASRRRLIIQTGIIALIAADLGIVGAIIMALITITPIKKLAQGLARIRGTEDKEQLRDHVIDVKSKDEIGMLATTVNQMTKVLVKAAITSKYLAVAKEVQKMFIPLAVDKSGRKGTTGGESTDQVEIYGYYEGAKGVSGDYFDYIKLADKYYAVIKCDVAGMGMPAALIMVEVATIFSIFFRNWTPKSPGLKIDGLVYMINDMLAERGFKGRFAALTLAVVNSESGKAYFCNAGDVNFHIYREDQRKMTEIKLPEAPAAGVFPSYLVELHSGFKLVSSQLCRGDTLFLFTEGIEIAKRIFRNDRFQPIVCDEPDLEEDEVHGGTHLKGSDNEELGVPRIYDIINSVFNHNKYQLQKFHNPILDEELVFDFTKCEGTVEEAVMAMIAVEKVFRIYPDPKATEDDRVYVDKPVDAFLEKHFEQYHDYFRRRLEGKEDDTSFGYSHLKEDAQYDDLTILAIRRK